ncbi:hypothetical protein LSUB1_G001537 [Lachnellula subtilissima]|uniref:Amidoligase enzyme n=1 Tax=Lachnellula subtilissima TaxID=602034 RepID=A0A8H8RXR3_9HELO|nr:hypothetical protein LSUB1_G001537 [Lachnellula subtilissima]
MSSTQTLEPPPRLHTRPIHYGVELEFVFAFRQDASKLGYTDGVADTIRKDLRLEPQMIVKRKLAEKLPNLHTLVRGTLSREDRALTLSEGYKKWIITVDHTVCGRGADIGTWLPEKAIDPNEWDSYGIELASRILNSGEPADGDEIEAIIDVVKGTKISNHNAFVTNQCGLHVHIEAPKDLNVSKELALLLIVYEEEISKLHPPCRRHGHPATVRSLNSNRLGFLYDEDTLTRHLSKIDCSTHILRQSESEILRGAKNKFVEIRQEIYSCQDAFALSRLMCWPAENRSGHEHGDRNRFTIEFRQARGTLVAEEIHHWVDFCVALVRLAESHAQNPGQFPIDSFQSYSKDGGATVLSPVNINRLIDSMGFGEEAREFWRHKISRYALYEKGDEDDRTDNEDPPEDDPLTDDEDGGEGEDGADGG